MWESRVLCEISKLRWKSFCDFHRSVISTAAAIFVFTSFAPQLGDSRPWPARRSSFLGYPERSFSSPRIIKSPRCAVCACEAFALGRDHRRVMREPIEQRGREFFVASEDGDPFGKREIRRDRRGPALVPVGDQSDPPSPEGEGFPRRVG
jgi:hypothetical protein